MRLWMAVNDLLYWSMAPADEVEDVSIPRGR